MKTNLPSKRKINRIKSVASGSVAAMAGIGPGMTLKSINGEDVKDIFDYHYLTTGDSLLISLIDDEGNNLEVKIQKAPDEDLGIEFDNALIDDYHSCNNNCIFCFIDQMPKGMRDTLYFKDDDTRLSFLQGNYVTLTNISEEELRRIINYRLAPINISVHVTDPDIRVKMLRNRFAGDILKKIEMIADAGLPMNGQVVLCKGINDGEVLKKTMEDLAGFFPHMQSLSVVPAGVTKFREGLYPLDDFTQSQKAIVIDHVESFHNEHKKRTGNGFVYAADEWYLSIKRNVPKDSYYDGYPQLENGVGMCRLLIEEFRDALIAERVPVIRKKKKVSIATGRLIYPVMKKLMDGFMRKFPWVDVRVYAIRNEFFGEDITVSGLITGQDIARQLRGRELGQRLLVPGNMLRADTDVFLDDMTLRDVSKELCVPVISTGSDGGKLLRELVKA